MQITKVTQDQIRMLDGKGNRHVVPNTSYFRLKYIRSNGRRIRYTFEKGIRIWETYDMMIFNAEYRGDATQIRPNYANILADAIEHHRDTGDISKFEKLFVDHYSLTYNTKLIESILSNYGERVIVVNDGFIIDDMFLVDRKGSAWVWNNEQKDKSGRGAAGSICLVVKSIPLSGYVDTDNGAMAQIDSTTMTVLAKIWFLLNPNTQDDVFMNQIPSMYREILKRNEMPKQNRQQRLFGKGGIDYS